MEVRNNGSASAILFVPSIAGYTDWSLLHTQLKARAELNPWDMHTFEYTSRWMPRLVRYGIRLSPNLTDVARQFATFCETTLGRYRTLAILAHSAGGFIALRALIDNESLRRRTTDLFLLGTPLDGSPRRLNWFLGLYRQVRDTMAGSKFLMHLNGDWRREIGSEVPFNLCLVRGIDDDMSPGEEAVAGTFPQLRQEMVTGDHSSMIRPHGPDSPIVQLIVAAFTGQRSSGARIFLSYVREDEGRVREIFKILEERGLRPWMDKRKLRLGENWKRELDKAIETSDRLVVFVSEAAISAYKKKGVFHGEVERALEIQNTLAPGRTFLIPVRLEDCNLPPLSKYQWFDLFSGQDAYNLASRLENSLT